MLVNWTTDDSGIAGVGSVSHDYFASPKFITQLLQI